jgi:hypothetical protein
MKKASVVLAACVTIASTSVLATHAIASKPGAVSSDFLTQTMGIRLVQTSTYDTAPKKLQAQVVNAERFASRGFPGAKINDDVEILALGEKRGKVKHARSGNAHVFHVTNDGTVVRE